MDDITSLTITVIIAIFLAVVGNTQNKGQCPFTTEEQEIMAETYQEIRHGIKIAIGEGNQEGKFAVYFEDAPGNFNFAMASGFRRPRPIDGFDNIESALAAGRQFVDDRQWAKTGITVYHNDIFIRKCWNDDKYQFRVQSKFESKSSDLNLPSLTASVIEGTKTALKMQLAFDREVEDEDQKYRLGDIIKKMPLDSDMRMGLLQGVAKLPYGKAKEIADHIETAVDSLPGILNWLKQSLSETERKQD